MNGPEAVFVLRNELNFTGPIIGIDNKLYIINTLVKTLSFVCEGITGNALPSDISHFVTNGANEVIIKPLTKAKLIDAIMRYFPRY